MTDLPQSATKQPNQDDAQTEDRQLPPQAPMVGVSKERPEIARTDKQEVTPITEYTRKVELEPEVEGWLEKSEREETPPPKPIVDKTTGQIVLGDAEPKKKFKVVLPLTREEVEKKQHYKVIESILWLREWCRKMVKMFGTKVAYRRSPES